MTHNTTRDPNIDKILKKRYLIHDETEVDMYQRVAAHLGRTTDEVIAFREAMNDGRMLPNSPTLRNAGTSRGGYSACYVLPLEDSLTGILDTVRDMAIIHKAFGGTGFDFSKLRPAGAPIASTGGAACGPEEVLALLNQTAQTVKQGGVRAGGNMAVIDALHPDMSTFITAKQRLARTMPDGSDGVHFNISVSVSDQFMECATQQYAPGAAVMKETKLLDHICSTAHATGCPGMLFLDRINKDNWCPELGRITATNPCLHGDTLIQTTEGEFPIRDLVGRDVDVYCIDPSTYTLKIAPAHNIVATKVATTFTKVVTTRTTILCTPDHKFFTKNRGWVEAANLTCSDKIVGLNRFPRNERHVMVMPTGRDRSKAVPEHRFVAAYYYDLKKTDIVHHVNEDPTDNRASNLEVWEERGQHSRYHNLGHAPQCPKSAETGQFIPKEVRKVAESNALGYNKVGVNLKVRSVSTVQMTDTVYDLTVDTYHNCFANGILVHNCGEQPLPSYGSCNLGSINLSKFVDPAGEWFNQTAFRATVDTAVRLLDAVIDKNQYPLKKVEELTRNYRPIGLGVMGWADTLMLLGIKWSSQEALELIDTIGQVLQRQAHETSVQLADTYGPYPAWNPGCERPYQRNACLTTIAPTGTLRMLAGCNEGIEPVYGWDVQRTDESGTRTVKHPLYEVARAAELLSDTALNITPEWHIAHQARWQQYIDNAVSKTINMPESATIEDIRAAYIHAWRMGCKGITIYRDNSKSHQVMKHVTNETRRAPVGVQRGSVERYGSTIDMPSGCGKVHITCNTLDRAGTIPHEVYVLTVGGCPANNEALGKLISLHIHDDRLAGHEGETVERIVRTLSKVVCPTCLRSKTASGKSCADIIARRMHHEWLEHAPGSGDKVRVAVGGARHCPDCGNELTFAAGCGSGTCESCGWSGCS